MKKKPNYIKRNKNANTNKDNEKKRIFNNTEINVNGDYNKIIIDKSNKNSKEYYNFCYSENNIIIKQII